MILKLVSSNHFNIKYFFQKKNMFYFRKMETTVVIFLCEGNFCTEHLLVPASTLYWACFKIYEKMFCTNNSLFHKNSCFFFTFLLFFQQACNPPLIFKISCTFYFNYFLVKIIIIVYSLLYFSTS